MPELSVPRQIGNGFEALSETGPIGYRRKGVIRAVAGLAEFGDNDEELPDDINDEKYISIPDKRELDLGKPLVLDFAREFLPDDYDEVRHIFRRRGAYRQY